MGKLIWSCLLFTLLLTAEVYAQPFDRLFYLGVEAHPTTLGYKVRSVTPGSPAGEAKIHRGDYIASVSGISVGYVGKDKYFPLVAALNTTAGQANLTVRFIDSEGRWRKMETIAQLKRRGSTVSSPDPLEIAVDEAQLKEAAALVLNSKTEEKKPLPSAQSEILESADQKTEMNPDKRGVLDNSLYPILPAEQE